LWAIVGLLCAAYLVIAYANLTAVWSARGRTFNDAAKVPATKVALVFGTTHRINGQVNLYFEYRIDAAEELWKSGKIDTLIVSGDNRTRYYNEPEKMRRSLVERGVPNDRIVCDYAGLRTLDSVVRCKEVFGAEKVLFISQKFHNERAIYLAEANGIDAVAYNARDVETSSGLKTQVREIGARVKMWLDVNFLDTQPKHLGDMEEMPE